MTKYIILFLILFTSVAYAEENYMSRDEKMFSMMFDLHSKEMGYKRTENICGFGSSMKERGYAIYKGKKYYPNINGIIAINTDKPR